MNDRRVHDAAIADLHHRMDVLEKLIRENIIIDSEHKEAMEQMILLWRGSKIVIPALAILIPTLLADVAWLRGHIRL